MRTKVVSAFPASTFLNMFHHRRGLPTTSGREASTPPLKPWEKASSSASPTYARGGGGGVGGGGVGFSLRESGRKLKPTQ